MAIRVVDIHGRFHVLNWLRNAYAMIDLYVYVYVYCYTVSLVFLFVINAMLYILTGMLYLY